MKPSDLKPPFNWEKRCISHAEHLFFIPPCLPQEEYLNASLPSFEEVFGKRAPVYLELCSGNGDWIIERAAAHPDSCWIALEKRFDRCRKIWSKMHNRCVSNLLIICGEAQTASKYCLKNASIDGIWVNFPDPWPKNRHAKFRLLQQPYFDEMARILKQGSCLTMVTDDVPYSGQIIKALLSHQEFASNYPKPHFITDCPDYGFSYFDDLWRQKGRTIHYMQYRRL